MATSAIVPIKVESCKECPHSVVWNVKLSKWFCQAMKGKTFKDPSVVQEWCPYGQIR